MTTASRGAASAPSAPAQLEIWALPWPEIGAGDDLVALLAAEPGLRAGDVVVVTSKVVSKSEGRLAHGNRLAAIAAETRRVVAQRGATVIAETRHGLVMAAAGVDASNTPPGTVLLLPEDPDASARALRAGIHAATGRNVAVIVSDTAGRAWRLGQTDIAIGCAGIDPLHDLQGTRDTHGNLLMVTAPAVADELAGAAELVKGKASGRPVAVVRGMAGSVLPPGDDGPGARALVRPAADDFFGLGVREAVEAAALRGDDQALDHFPRIDGSGAESLEALLAAWQQSLVAKRKAIVTTSRPSAACAVSSPPPAWALQVDVTDDADTTLLVAVGRLLERCDVLAAAHRLTGHDVAVTPTDPPCTRVARCWHDH